MNYTNVWGDFWAYSVEIRVFSKSNHVHADIFRFFLMILEVYALNSIKLMGNFPEVLNFNRSFLKLNRFICNYRSVRHFRLKLNKKKIQAELKLNGGGALKLPEMNFTQNEIARAS